MVPFLGDIYPWAGARPPRGFLFCHGQLLTIRENLALFSVLLTTYGGDGRQTFALPDLRGRVPVGVGTADGVRATTLGEQFGDSRTATSAVTGGEQVGSLPTAPAPGEIGSNVSPSLGLNYIIATKGVYPSRSWS